jgi:hypothetical protein
MPDRYRMHTGISTLGPAYVQAPGGEVDVVPTQCHQLRGSEAVAVGDQDGDRVPVPGAVLLGGLDKPLHLPLGEIFASASANCYIYEVGAATRSRDFSMEMALPPVHTVTNLLGRVTD